MSDAEPVSDARPVPGYAELGYNLSEPIPELGYTEPGYDLVSAMPVPGYAELGYMERDTTWCPRCRCRDMWTLSEPIPAFRIQAQGELSQWRYKFVSD